MVFVIPKKNVKPRLVRFDKAILKHKSFTLCISNYDYYILNAFNQTIESWISFSNILEI